MENTSLKLGQVDAGVRVGTPLRILSTMEDCQKLTVPRPVWKMVALLSTYFMKKEMVLLNVSFMVIPMS